MSPPTHDSNDLAQSTPRALAWPPSQRSDSSDESTAKPKLKYKVQTNQTLLDNIKSRFATTPASSPSPPQSMGCFLACFGGGAGHRRRRSPPRQSPARSPALPPPPRRDNVALVGKASVLANMAVKEVPPSLPKARDLTLPPVEVAGEVVSGPSPSKEPRELSEQASSPMRSLPPEKQVTPPLSPQKCSTVVAAVASSPDPELRELSEQGSLSSGKKKATFDMNVTMYENATVPAEEEEMPQADKKSVDEDGKNIQKTVVFPANHRYQHCAESDDDGDRYGEDDCDDDDEEEEEEDDFEDCGIGMVDEEEMGTEEKKQESHDSFFSLPVAKGQQDDQEVSSPAPKSISSPVEEPSPIIQGNNPRDRSQFVRPVLNPVHNLSQWKEVKSRAVPIKKVDKENVNSVPDVDASNGSELASQTKASPNQSSQKEVSVDASLCTWLASSDNATVDKAQSKSPHSISSVSQEERPVLGALTVNDLNQSSVTSSPRRSPVHSHEETPILGTVGSHWSRINQDSVYCSSRSSSGTNGIPNTTSKYSEDRKVNWHSTPFGVRLDRALKKSSA